MTQLIPFSRYLYSKRVLYSVLACRVLLSTLPPSFTSGDAAQLVWWVMRSATTPLMGVTPGVSREGEGGFDGL